jgi:hypothetical protein
LEAAELVFRILYESLKDLALLQITLTALAAS